MSGMGDAFWTATRARLDAGFARELPHFFDGLPAAHLNAVEEVLAGGKRLRGGLVCLLNEALGGDAAAAVPRAMAVECVQAASLIHDDLVDGDAVRRNHAATWTQQGPRRAVLLADLMFATALHRMARLGREDVQALAEAIATLAAGAYQEPLAASDLARLPDRADFYPRLIHLKTGVLFGAAARLGAIAAGQPMPVAALAFDYGARIGEAYQMADDLQDVVTHAWMSAPSPSGGRPGWGPRAADGVVGGGGPLPCPPPEGEGAAASLLLWHFCTDGAVSNLRARLGAAIERRIEQAIAIADQLPGGRMTGVLRSAPRDIVRAMADGAP